ncbi:MAG: hypothetical protein ED559_02005 [Phycisphaera sp.]|nr:MAG: hypothetical protein ED559_02005 [Phycisphaera sp.]
MDADAALALRLILAIGTALLLTFTVGRVLMRLDWRGAGVVGGVCAGIALGPLVFGNLSPTFYEQLNKGGIAERNALEAFIDQRAEDEAALAEVGVSEEALVEAELQNDARESRLRSELAIERIRFKGVPLGGAAVLGLIYLMLGSWLGFGLSLSGLRIGTLAGLIAVLIWAVVSRKVMGVGLTESVLAGALIAGGTCWSRGRWRYSIGLGSVLLVLAVIAVAGATHAAWTACVAVGLGAMLSRTSRLSMRARARWSFAAHAVLAPSAIALLVSVFDLTPRFDLIAFVLVAGVFAGDAHLIAAWIAMGWQATGRRRELPISSWTGVYSQGWTGTSLVLTGLVFASGALELHTPTGGAIVLAVALHAAFVEMTRPATARLLASMRQDR